MLFLFCFFFFKQKTAYEMRISDWSSDVCSSDLGQVKKLEASGIETMAALARHDGPVRGVASATAEKLVGQARLQHARKTGEPAFELRPAQPGKGFDLLPRPQAGDLFYDIEGDPHYRSEENTSELQSLMRISYAVFC